MDFWPAVDAGIHYVPSRFISRNGFSFGASWHAHPEFRSTVLLPSFQQVDVLGSRFRHVLYCNSLFVTYFDKSEEQKQGAKANKESMPRSFVVALHVGHDWGDTNISSKSLHLNFSCVSAGSSQQ